MLPSSKMNDQIIAPLRVLRISAEVAHEQNAATYHNMNWFLLIADGVASCVASEPG